MYCIYLDKKSRFAGVYGPVEQVLIYSAGHVEAFDQPTNGLEVKSGPKN